MQFIPFEMERFQSLWENVIDYNLSESGVHPLQLNELAHHDQLDQLSRLKLGYNQTNGSVALREAIARLYPGSSVENILATTGSAEANFLATLYLLEPGDELVFMLPNYMQIWGIAQSLGAIVKTFSLVPMQGSWRVDWREFENALSPKTKMIAVCNPNNPTGTQLNQDEIELICHAAAKVNAWIVADEVYRGAEQSGVLTPSFWGHYEKTIITGGLSKAYGLPGLRIGWAIAPAEVIGQLWSYHDYTTICPNAMSDFLAQIALAAPKREQILERTRSIIRANYALLDAWLQSHDGIFEWIPPVAGAIAFIKYHLKNKSLDLVTQLREQKSVLIVPGSQFLMENYLRIGFGSPADYLRDALARVSEFLEENGD
jgi:aspartate/methionine/tyrosine aminotransferase